MSLSIPTAGAQTPPAPEPPAAAPAAAQEAASAADSLQKIPDESVAAFVRRINAETPDQLASQVQLLFAAQPASSLSALVTLVGTEGEASPITQAIVSGLKAEAGSNPVLLAQQISPATLANQNLIPLFITIARIGADEDFGETIGEGLALAANNARQRGYTALAASIQSQATAAAAPEAVAKAFRDNVVETAAGAGAGAGGGGGGGAGAGAGDVGNNPGSGIGGGVGEVSSLTTQLAGTGAPTATSLLSAGLTDGGADPSPATP